MTTTEQKLKEIQKKSIQFYTNYTVSYNFTLILLHMENYFMRFCKFYIFYVDTHINIVDIFKFT